MSALNIVLIIINFIGALAVFLFGMKLMSEGLQKVAGNGLRNILSKMTNNPVRGILTGVLVTTAIQSSSATTVMVVSFVNAGLITLSGAIAVIMGANIGTTVTAWIITLFGLGQTDGLFSLPLLLAAIAMVFMFNKKDKMKSLSEFIIGLALLLIGLDLLQAAMPDLQQYPKLLEALGSLSNYGFWSILIFIVIGALLTCIMQSSSASMAVTLVMCYKGWIGFDVSVALVMGQNIGTTITANLAAMVANSTAKKAARAHLVFNVIGVLLTLIVFRPMTHIIADMTQSLTGFSPYSTNVTEASTAIPWALSLFHTAFNVLNTLILVWFIPQIIKLVDMMVKTDSEDKEDEFRLVFISRGYLNTAELNLQAAQKEIENFSKRVLRMYTFLPGLRTAKDEDEFNAIVHRIEKYEAITDRMELEIANFLTKISEGELSEHGSQRISAMLRIIDNLESIGDAIYQMAMLRKSKRETEVHFDDELNANIAHMSQLVQNALDVMDKNLHTDYSVTSIDINESYRAEDAINKYRDVLRNRHLDALKLGVYDYTIGSVYSSIYSLYEKMGDYIINVSEAIDNSKKASENKEELKMVDETDDVQ